jgi:hypothetical protein
VSEHHKELADLKRMLALARLAPLESGLDGVSTSPTMLKTWQR